MFILLTLFLAIAHAATSYMNATTTSSSSSGTITSSASLSSASCSPGPGLGALIGCDVGIINYQPPNPISRLCTGADNKGNFMNCKRSGLPIYTFDYASFLNPYDITGTINTAIPSTITDQCYSQWNTSIENWWRTAPITGVSVVPATTYLTTPQIVRGTTWSFVETIETIITVSTTILGAPTLITTSGTTTYLDSGPFTWSEYTQQEYVSSFSFTAQSPCCFNCTLSGGTVQVFYWPTAAPEAIANSTAPAFRAANSTAAPPAVSTLINSAGFSFVSPSIYVAFESLRAKDLCGQVGPVYTSTTLAFDPTDLSTSKGYHWDTAAYGTNQPRIDIWAGGMTFTQATWGDQESCSDTVTSFLQSDGHLGIEYTVTFNPCSPTMSVPKEVFTLYSDWKTCGLGISGFFDPPSALTPGTGLSLFTTAAPAIVAPVNAGTTTQAAAGSTPAPVVPSATANPTPSPTPAAPPVKSNDSPAQSPPANNPSGQAATTNDPPAQVPSAISPAGQASSIASAAQVEPPAASNPQVQSSAAANNPPANPATSNNPQSQLPAANSQPQAADPPASITVGSSVIAAGSSSVFVIASQTLTPGGQIVHSGTQYSLASNAGALVIGGTSTQIIAPAAQAAPSITIGGSIIKADSSSAFVVASQTLTPGGQITYSGINYSLAPNGAALIVGGTATQAIATASPIPSPPGVITVNGSPITANPSSAFIIGSQTLALGSQITDSGIVYSLALNGGTLVVGGSSTQIIAAPAVTPASSYLVGSQTLSAGGAAVTVSGTVYSLPTGGSSVVVNGATQPISALLPTIEYVLGSQTLAAGASAITVSGSVISLQPDGSSVVVGGKTEPLSALLGSSTTAVQGLGGIIATLGGFGSASSSSTPTYVQLGSGGSTNGSYVASGLPSRGNNNIWVMGLGLGIGVIFVGML